MPFSGSIVVAGRAWYCESKLVKRDVGRAWYSRSSFAQRIELGTASGNR
jgi:hypothetical protein